MGVVGRFWCDLETDTRGAFDGNHGRTYTGVFDREY